MKGRRFSSHTSNLYREAQLFLFPADYTARRSFQEETNMAAINILDWSGKHPAVPMKARGALVNIVKTDSGDPQKAALAASARSGLPPAPPGGKVNILA